MLVYLALALLKVASIAPRTLRTSAIPATAQTLSLSKTLPSTRDMADNCTIHRTAATTRLVPIPSPRTPERTASNMTNKSPIPTFVSVRYAPPPLPVPSSAPSIVSEWVMLTAVSVSESHCIFCGVMTFNEWRYWLCLNIWALLPPARVDAVVGRSDACSDSVSSASADMYVQCVGVLRVSPIGASYLSICVVAVCRTVQ